MQNSKTIQVEESDFQRRDKERAKAVLLGLRLLVKSNPYEVK
jgi:hypothetical protein